MFIPLNLQEIFTWYFEQKGVDNPERFLAQGVNEVNEGVNEGVKERGTENYSVVNNPDNISDENPLPLSSEQAFQSEQQPATISQEQKQQSSVSPDILMQLDTW